MTGKNASRRWALAHPEHHRRIKALQQRRYAKRYPEKMRAHAVRQARRRRLRALEMVGGPRCVNCGCTDPRALEINHKNGGGGKQAREAKARHTGLHLTRLILSGKLNPADFDVRCRLCNALDYLERTYPALKGRWTVLWRQE